MSAFDGRPSLPLGMPQSDTTLRFTLSRAMARLIARFRQERSPCRVRVLHDPTLPASHLSTSSALRSRIRRAPNEGRTCVLHNEWTAFKVATSRPAKPKASQSFTACATV